MLFVCMACFIHIIERAGCSTEPYENASTGICRGIPVLILLEQTLRELSAKENQPETLRKFLLHYL